MATAEELAQRIEDMEEAIDSGVLSVKMEDKTITYRSLGDMIKALNRLKTKAGQGIPMNRRSGVIKLG